jgi:hypothetical protein
LVLAFYRECQTKSYKMISNSNSGSVLLFWCALVLAIKIIMSLVGWIAWHPHFKRILDMTSMKKEDYAPIVMWFCLFTGIIVLAFTRPARLISVLSDYPINFDTAFMISYILWMLIELRVSKKEVNTEGKRTSILKAIYLVSGGPGSSLTADVLYPEKTLPIANLVRYYVLNLFKKRGALCKE